MGSRSHQAETSDQIEAMPLTIAELLCCAPLRGECEGARSRYKVYYPYSVILVLRSAATQRDGTL